MTNPYHILGVAADADDQTIRQAYLKAVKEYSPDSQPKRFQILSDAYAQIKDQTSRHRHILFSQECPADSPLDALIRFGSHCRQFEPLPLDAMKEFLTTVARESGK